MSRRQRLRRTLRSPQRQHRQARNQGCRRLARRLRAMGRAARDADAIRAVLTVIALPAIMTAAALIGG